MLKAVALGAGLILSTTAAQGDEAARLLAANKAASGGAAWDGKQTLRLSFHYSGQGFTGTTSSLQDLKHGRFVDSYITPPESGASGFDGKTPWLRDISGMVSNQEGGDTPALSVNEAYRDRNQWWQPDFGGAAVVSAGVKQDDGKTYDVLTVTPKGGKPFDAWFAADTHLLARIVEVQGPQTVTTRFSDYRTVDGVKIAGKLVIDDGGGAKYAQTLTLEKAEFLPAQKDSAYAKPVATVHDYAIADGASETTVPFRLLNNHVYADVTVNGKGPFNFIFDTGGHNNLTPRTAKLITLNVVGQAEGGGAGEGKVEVGDARVQSLQIGKAVIRDQIFGVLDFEKPETAGYVTDGMVGVQTFRRFVTRFDYGAHTITLIDPKRFDPKDSGVPVHIIFDGNVPLVEAKFEGLPGKYYVDTGSRDELGLTRPFAEAENLRATHPKGVEAIDGWGVGGPTRSFVTMGKSLAIGPITLTNVVTSFSLDKGGAFVNKSYQGNIGSAILKRFVVTFDYPHETMYLKPLAGPVADTGVFDRSGMWINTDPDGFKIVDVTRTGPAEAAGLKGGDVITAVDGKPAADIHLFDLRQRLRDEAPGTVITFAVKRAGRTRDVRVTLRSLI